MNHLIFEFDDNSIIDEITYFENNGERVSRLSYVIPSTGDCQVIFELSGKESSSLTIFRGHFEREWTEACAILSVLRSISFGAELLSDEDLAKLERARRDAVLSQAQHAADAAQTLLEAQYERARELFRERDYAGFIETLGLHHPDLPRNMERRRVIAQRALGARPNNSFKPNPLRGSA